VERLRVSRWRRRLRRLRRTLVLALAGLLILAGLVVALLSQWLPTLQSRPQEVAAYMQRQLGVPVRLDAVDAAWTGSGVRLQLSGLRIGDEHGPQVPDATLWLRPFHGWWPGNTLSTLQIRGPQLVVERERNGAWSVQGLGLAAADQAMDLQLLERLGEVVLDHASLQLRSADDGLDLQLARVDARMRPLQGRLALALQVFVDDSPPLQLRLQTSADLREGRLHIGLRRAPLARWLRQSMTTAWQLPESQGHGDLWLDWAEGRLLDAQFRATLQPLPALPEAGPALRAAAAMPEPEPLSLQGRWLRSAEGDQWLLGSPADIATPSWARLSQRGTVRVVEAGDWQVAALWPWIAGTLPVDAAQRVQLQALAPSGRLQSLRAEAQADGPWSWWAVLDALGTQRVGKLPGLQGLALRAEGVDQRALLAIDAEPLRVDWVSLAEVMRPELRGNIMLWRDPLEQAWCLHALQLSLREADYAAEAEGGLCFAGGPPSADLRVAVAAAEVTTAKRFWILDRMPAPAVEWLNQALQAGRLARGALLLHGDLAHWPFRGGQGRFEAVAELDALQLKFRPNWPPGESLSGTARFVNDGLEVEGRAEIAGVQVGRLSGRIPRYRDARLYLDLEGMADGSALLGLLRESPLWTTLAAGLERVRVRGPASVNVALNIPFKQVLGPPTVRGSVLLEESDLRHEEWGIALDAASGRIDFSERGMRAEGLDVLHVGRPASLSLRVGSFAEDPANLLEAQLLGRLDAGALLDTQPELDWLKPAVDGVSRWDIGLEVPVAGGLPPRLLLDSDLVGSALRLPAPLRKSAATPLPLALEVAIEEQTKQVQLQLGQLLTLRGRWDPQQSFNGVAAFGGASLGERPVQGVKVLGEVAALDLGGWLTLAGDGGELIDSVDLRSGDFDLFGRGFGEVRLQYRQHPEGRVIALEGERLAGEVTIPDLLQVPLRGITARFDRVYWPAGLRADVDTLGEGIDPGALPALHLHVEDLRLGEAVIGDTRLETYPQPGALHVEQFNARSEALSLSARGDWRSLAEGSASRFSVEFASRNLGEMLQALGFAEFVEGGETIITLEGEWPGAPSAFALDKVDGKLALSVGSGRIPDADPGAGRLFGLFSLSEIPRRLALDFSDFFRSGLAFNKIEGEFVLKDGSAFTDALLIDSPAAEIRLRGRTGLREQEYAQTMEVLPRAGNVLPVVGALAAGPAGAALGAVAQAVLQKPFKQITRTLYSVNGSWDRPDIDIIERGPARPAAPGEPGVPGP
jgi:uncharacterized protein (TIGR02099 family)